MHMFLVIYVCGSTCARVLHGMISLTILQVCPMLIRVFPQVGLLPPRFQSSCMDCDPSCLPQGGSLSWDVHLAAEQYLADFRLCLHAAVWWPPSPRGLFKERV